MNNKPFFYMFMFIVLSIPLLITMKTNKAESEIDFMKDSTPPPIVTTDTGTK